MFARVTPVREAFFFWFPSARPSVLRGSKITVFFSGRAITEQQIIFQSHVPPHNPYKGGGYRSEFEKWIWFLVILEGGFLSEFEKKWIWGEILNGFPSEFGKKWIQGEILNGFPSEFGSEFGLFWRTDCLVNFEVNLSILARIWYFSSRASRAECTFPILLTFGIPPHNLAYSALVC